MRLGLPQRYCPLHPPNAFLVLTMGVPHQSPRPWRVSSQGPVTSLWPWQTSPGTCSKRVHSVTPRASLGGCRTKSHRPSPHSSTAGQPSGLLCFLPWQIKGSTLPSCWGFSPSCRAIRPMPPAPRSACPFDGGACTPHPTPALRADPAGHGHFSRWVPVFSSCHPWARVDAVLGPHSNPIHCYHLPWEVKGSLGLARWDCSYLSPLARAGRADPLCSAPIRPHPGPMSSLGSQKGETSIMAHPGACGEETKGMWTESSQQCLVGGCETVASDDTRDFQAGYKRWGVVGNRKSLR